MFISLAFLPLHLVRCSTHIPYISTSIYADFRLGVVDYRSRGTSTSERSKIDSTMPGVRLIGDTYAPITTLASFDPTVIWLNQCGMAQVARSPLVRWYEKRKRIWRIRRKHASLRSAEISIRSIDLATIIVVKIIDEK